MVKEISFRLQETWSDMVKWFGLVGLYGISTIVGYLMPNPLYTYELYMICKHIVDDIFKQTWAKFF